MDCLLDTDAISEWVNPVPTQVSSAGSTKSTKTPTYLSVITLGELPQKASTASPTDDDDDGSTTGSPPNCPNASPIASCPSTLPSPTSEGRLLARTEAAGITIHGTDALIAAVAHQLQIVTRNVARFQPTGIDILSPWQN